LGTRSWELEVAPEPGARLHGCALPTGSPPTSVGEPSLVYWSRGGAVSTPQTTGSSRRPGAEGDRGGVGYFSGAAHSKPTEAVQDVARGFGQGFSAPPLLESTPLWRAVISRGVIERGAPPALFWSVL
jgi:hypothetical protein